MTIGQRFAALIATVAITIGAMAAPAHADPTTGPTPEPTATVPPTVGDNEAAAAAPLNCPLRSVCGYVDNSYQTGEGWETIPEYAPGTCVVVTFRNKWTSVWNNTSRPIRLWTNTTCNSSAYMDIKPGTGSKALWWDGVIMNDVVDAISFR